MVTSPITTKDLRQYRKIATLRDILYYVSGLVVIFHSDFEFLLHKLSYLILITFIIYRYN